MRAPQYAPHAQLGGGSPSAATGHSSKRHQGGKGARRRMFPFWEVAIRPVLEAAGARRVIEIGALRGETTTLMLECLGADAELHVIDPVPEFDPAEHERAFPGRYIFHRDISHSVLPLLPPADVALIDGDHN